MLCNTLELGKNRTFLAQNWRLSADTFRDVEQLSIAGLRAYVVQWRKHNLHILVLSYNKRESRRLDSLVTSLSGLDDGDGRHVITVLGLALGELQLNAARLAKSDGRRFRVAVEASRPGQAHLGKDGTAVVVSVVVLGEGDNGEGLVLHSGEVECIYGDTVREGVDKLLCGNLLAVVLESGQQGGVHCGFTEVKHNFISFLCGRQAGLFIQSRRLDLNWSEFWALLARPIFWAIDIALCITTTVIVYFVIHAFPTDTF